MASVAVGLELGIPFETVKAALETVEGVQRRLEIKGNVNGITIVDDYGHHPTEIKTTLQAAKEAWPDRRMVVVFQPHRYSRTRALFDEFTRSFYQSDVLLVLPIYSAGEKVIEGVDSASMCDGIRQHGHKEVTCKDTIAAAVAGLKDILVPGDILLTLGAGDVWKVGEEVLRELGTQEGGKIGDALM
jgi:UDP-N-acetylmuramate--alanine ligase